MIKGFIEEDNLEEYTQTKNQITNKSVWQQVLICLYCTRLGL